MIIDVYYWFDKSTKRKAVLADYYTFCDIAYRDVVKHVNIRWLSFDKAVYRVLNSVVPVSFFNFSSSSSSRVNLFSIYSSNSSSKTVISTILIPVLVPKLLFAIFRFHF